MTGEPWPPIEPDSPGQIILIVGRRGSGKSVHARELFRQWPGVDRLVIDPNGDADVVAPTDPATRQPLEVVKTTTPPTALPAREGDRPVVSWYVANPASATYREDLDRAVGAALFPKARPVLLWVDEADEVFPVERTGPHARLLLRQSRHFNAHAIIVGPRPVGIAVLCLAQATRVVMYDLPHPDDRKRIAGAIGWPYKDTGDEPGLDSILNETKSRGEHWFTIYDQKEHAIYRCPPLRIPAESAH